MSDIQVGDVVRLKSGGQKMTVEDIGDYAPLGPSQGAKCVWFDDKNFACEKVFAVAVLEKVAPPRPGGLYVSRA